MKTTRHFAWMIVLRLSFALPAEAQNVYRVTDLGDLPGGEDFSFAYGVSENGHVVGYSKTATGNRAFLWTSGGGMQNLGSLPSGKISEARGINDVGHVVGFSSTAMGDRAFLWTNDGGMQDLGDLPGGASFSRAYDINNNGQVVGESGAATGTRGFLWSSGGGLEDLGDLPGGSDESNAIAINENGQVAGSSSGAAGRHAFVWTRGSGMQDLSAPPRLGTTEANGINASADVVGYGHFPNELHALLWPSGGGVQEVGEFFGGFTYRSATDINDSDRVVGGTSSPYGEPSGAFVWTSSDGFQFLSDLVDSSGAGWTLRTATAINNAGQIVGFGENPSGASHAFLLTPIPEPTTCGLAIAAMVVAIGVRLRKSRLKPAARGLELLYDTNCERVIQ